MAGWATVSDVSSRWSSDPDVPRGERYDERFRRLATSGANVHGEADLVESLLGDRSTRDGAGQRVSVLDAGCGTGRVAIELARRGFDVVGVDLDAAMLAAARAKAPQLAWHIGDLATLDLGRSFDAVVLAGNVMVFVTPGDEAAVVARCAAHLAAGGLLIVGFQVATDRFDPADLDEAGSVAGLTLIERWATWDRKPWPGDGLYQVSVHRAG